MSRLRGFVWADLDGEGVPDAALLDDQGVLRVFLNLRGGEFRERDGPFQFPRVAAIAAAEVSGDGILDVVGVGADGTVMRLSQRHEWLQARGRAHRAGRCAVRPGAGAARVLVADLDNNGAGDLVISSPASVASPARRGGRSLPSDRRHAARRVSRRPRISTATVASS